MINRINLEMTQFSLCISTISESGCSFCRFISVFHFTSEAWTKWKNWRNIWHDSNVYSKESLILDLNMFGSSFSRNTISFQLALAKLL